jgi:hypothetical protein
MKTNCKFLIFITLASILIMPTNLRADNTIVLGGQTTYNGKRLLELTVYGSATPAYAGVISPWGYYAIGQGGNPGYEPFALGTPCVNIKIGTTVFTSFQNSPVGTTLTAVDVSTGTNTSGVVQYVTKTFSGTYNGIYPFSVDWKITYDKNDPYNFTEAVKVNPGNIPSGTPILLDKSWTFMPRANSAPVTVPNIMRSGIYLNGSGTTSSNQAQAILTNDEVQSLSIIANANTIVTVNGSLIALYPISHRFDRVYVGDDLQSYSGHPGVNYLLHDPGDVIEYLHSSLSAYVVAYNIPTGMTTEIQTGTMFLDHLPIDLDYTWQNNDANPEVYSKDLAVPMGTDVSLRLAANNYNTDILNDVGFLVNMPSGFPIVSTPTYTGFTTPPTVHTPGTTSYQVATGRIPALTNGVVLAPVSTVTYGQWIIDQTMISNMSNIVPIIGTLPAVLTVTTEVNYDPAPAGNVGIVAGTNKTFYIKLPTGVAPLDRNVEVYLEFTGATGSFNTTTPTHVTIPSGSGVTSLTIAANPGAPVGQSITIKLTGTNYAPVEIGEDDELTLTVEPQIHYIPVNPHLRSMIVVQ